MILAKNVRKHLARLIGHVQTHDAAILGIEPGRTRPDPVSLPFDDFNARTALQLQLQKGALGGPESGILGPPRIERAIRRSKLSAQFRAMFLADAWRAGSP